MAYTEVKVISGVAGKFNVAMAAAIAAGFQPVSAVTVELSQSYSVIVAKGSGYSITEAKVVNGLSRKALFEEVEQASADGFTIDSVNLESGQQFAFVYKGSKGGGATAVAWGDVTGKPTTFAPIIGTGAAQAMAGNLSLSTIAGTVPVSKGGTGAATADAGLTALGVSAAMLPVVKSASNPAARTALGLGPSAAAPQQAAQANSVATDVAGVVADLNALLAKLRSAAIIAA